MCLWLFFFNLPLAHLPQCTLFASLVITAAQEKLKTYAFFWGGGGQIRCIMGDVQLANIRLHNDIMAQYGAFKKRRRGWQRNDGNVAQFHCIFSERR